MRLHQLLCGDGLPGAFGVGTVRTLAACTELSGIDYKNAVITDPFRGQLI